MTTEIPLEAHGFATFKFGAHGIDLDFERDYAAIRDAFLDLPADPYGAGSNRYRRYSRLILIPWRRAMDWIPPVRDGDGVEVTPYFQGKFNPQFPDQWRKFPVLPEPMRSNPLLQKLIWHDFDQTFWTRLDASAPQHVGVHFVKLRVNCASEEAVASPNHLHRDGEAFTFAHLVVRDNVVGGINTIAPTGCVGLSPADIDEQEVLARFELIEPLDSYGVCDAKVSHCVSGIRRGPALRAGERSVILIDFSPFVPGI